MATTTQTVTTKTVVPSAPSAASIGLHWGDAALVAATALIPMALSVLGLVPNPATQIAAMVLGAVWVIAKTVLSKQHLDSNTLAEQVRVLEAAFEKATGKTIPADIKTAIEFGSGAIAEQAGLTTPTNTP